MPRLTRLYTRKGDDGTTGLGGGQRVAKDSLRVAAYGTVDELSSAIGVALAGGLVPRLATALPAIQNELFHLGSDLCFVEEDKRTFTVPQIEPRHVEALERLIDELNDSVGALENFILPGGVIGAAQLHLARTNLPARRARRHRPVADRAGRPARHQVSEPPLGRALRHGALREPAAGHAGAALGPQSLKALEGTRQQSQGTRKGKGTR